MPISATITSFYSFTENTKARASQVNNNFDLFKGHRIPIHTSTATSANATYDLGSTEYYWRNGYINNLYIEKLYGSASNKVFNSKIVNKSFSFQTSGSFDLFGSLTITSNNTKNIEIGVTFSNTSTSDAYLYTVSNTVGTAQLNYEIYLYRNTTTSLVGRSMIRTTPLLYIAPTFQNRYASVYLSQLKFMDLSVSAGTHTYFYKCIYNSGVYTTSNSYDVYFTDLKMYAREF